MRPREGIRAGAGSEYFGSKAALNFARGEWRIRELTHNHPFGGGKEASDKDYLWKIKLLQNVHPSNTKNEIKFNVRYEGRDYPF